MSDYRKETAVWLTTTAPSSHSYEGQCVKEFFSKLKAGDDPAKLAQELKLKLGQKKRSRP